MASVTGIPATLLVVTRQHGAASEQGTWVHPKVAINLALKQPAVLQLDGASSPAPRGKAIDLMVDDKPDVTDLAALFLPVEASGEEPWVDARRLHEALGVGKDFSNWIKDRIKVAGFVEETDYYVCSPISASKECGVIRDDGDDVKVIRKQGRGGHNVQEYSLTLDMAKHLALLERNEQGGKVRRYFIACEKELQRRQRADMVPARALTQSNSTVKLLCEVVNAGGVNLALTEESKKAAIDRAEKAEQALAAVARQPATEQHGLTKSLALAWDTEKERAAHWEAAARDQVFALQAWQARAKNWEREALALQEKIKTMVPRLIPTDTMSMTGFVDAYPELGLGRNQLTTFLRARGVLYTGPHKNGGVERPFEPLLITSHIDSGNCAISRPSVVSRMRTRNPTPSSSWGRRRRRRASRGC
jgi:phage anti-repressor protein